MAGISYAGVNLPVWTEAQAAWVAENICPRSLFEFDGDYNKRSTLKLASPGDWLPRKVKVGALRWPLGATRWSTFHAVVDFSTLADVREACLHNPGSSSSTYYDPKPLILDDDLNTPLTTNLTILSARPLDAFSSFFLLTLVDARWFWWQRAGSISSVSTWAALIQAIATAMGEGTVTIPTISSSYQTPDSTRWTQTLQPLPVLLDAACYAVGRRLVRSLSGTLTAQQWTDAQTANNAEFSAAGRTLLAGGRQAINEIQNAVPASVTVAFSNGGTPTSVAKTLTSLSIATYGTAPGRANESAVIAAEYLGTNGTNQANYATAAATDAYGWLLADADAVWVGDVGCAPNGFAGLIEWDWSVNAGRNTVRYQAPARPVGAARSGFEPATSSTPPFTNVRIIAHTSSGPPNLWTANEIEYNGSGSYIETGVQFTNCIEAEDRLTMVDTRSMPLAVSAVRAFPLSKLPDGTFQFHIDQFADYAVAPGGLDVPGLINTTQQFIPGGFKWFTGNEVVVSTGTITSSSGQVYLWGVDPILGSAQVECRGQGLTSPGTNVGRAILSADGTGDASLSLAGSFAGTGIIIQFTNTGTGLSTMEMSSAGASRTWGLNTIQDFHYQSNVIVAESPIGNPNSGSGGSLYFGVFRLGAILTGVDLDYHPPGWTAGAGLKIRGGIVVGTV